MTPPLSVYKNSDLVSTFFNLPQFFKWLKQNLKIKTFLGTSKNAVMTQIWIALTTMLILSYMKFLAKLEKSITQIQRLLQLNLFKKQSLWELFDPPLIKHRTENPQKMLFDFKQLQPDSSDPISNNKRDWARMTS